MARKSSFLIRVTSIKCTEKTEGTEGIIWVNTRTPLKGPLIEALWPLIVGICGILEGSWGVSVPRLLLSN